MTGTISHLEATMKFLGFDPDIDSIGINALVYLAMVVAMTADNIILLNVVWEDIDTRMVVFKNIIAYCMFFSYTITYVLTWNDITAFVRVIQEKHERFLHEKCSDTKEMMINEFESVVGKQTKIIYFSVQIFLATASICSFITGTVKIFNSKLHHQNIEIELLPLPYTFYYPHSSKTIFGYYMVLLLQTVFNKYGMDICYIIFASMNIAMHKVKTDMKLLRYHLTDIEEVIQDIYDNVYCESFQERTTCFFRYVVNYHQDIYRTVGVVNRGIQGVALTFNSGVSLYVCTGVYYIIQKDDLQLKIIIGLPCALALYFAYMLSNNGETIITEDENLRKAFYECSWIDKPQWVKTTLIIAMSRNMRPMQLKPFGLFVISLRNFAMIIKAVYSYYNIINSFSNK